MADPISDVLAALSGTATTASVGNGGDGGDEKEAGRDVTLEAEHELRFEVARGATVTVTLKNGSAEIFGAELAVGDTQTFSGAKAAVFTWFGCTLTLTGDVEVEYTAGDTPMGSYLNIHAALEDRRQVAKEGGREGPRLLICGPTDVGKSTLTKILINYAVREARKPVYVDLDIGQGGITIPTMLAAVQIDLPLETTRSLEVAAPIVFHYGDTTPSSNMQLYKDAVERLAGAVDERMAADRDAMSSGVIVNTCGWIDGDGFELLIDAVQKLKPTVIVVMGHDRLYNDLQSAVGAESGIEIAKVAKSGGVVVRSPVYRAETRTSRVAEYFYGPSRDLSPLAVVMKFTDISIYKAIPKVVVPDSVLPLGATQSSSSEVKVVEVLPDSSLVNSIVAVSHAEVPSKLLDTNVAGFLHVTDVDEARGMLTALAPAHSAIPGRFLLLTTLTWIE